MFESKKGNVSVDKLHRKNMTRSERCSPKGVARHGPDGAAERPDVTAKQIVNNYANIFAIAAAISFMDARSQELMPHSAE